MSKLLAVCFKEAEIEACAEFASKIGASIDVAVFRNAPANAAGAQTCYVLDCDSDAPADSVGSALAQIASTYDVLASVNSMAGKDVLFRIAGAESLPAVTDIVEVLSPTEFKRPLLAGSALATVKVNSARFAATIRASAFKGGHTGSAQSVQTIPVPAGKTTVTERASAASARPDLTQAKIVVSGGKPLGSKEKFEELIGGLADSLGGAVGATRAAVDNGIAGNDLQIGQTGKVVAPDLYIAVGISGAAQHAAGIKDSKVIVAVNKDPEAPIFGMADLGLKADLFEAVPELIQKLKGQP